jgi:ATPase family associated with various cellular activities (AAA)
VLQIGRLADGADIPPLAGPLATLLHAVPVAELDLAPAETAELTRPPALAGPVAVAIGRQGGLAGSTADGAVTLTLGVPEAAARRRHWEAALGDGADVDELAARFRMTGGNIRRVARLARASAALAGSPSIEPADVRRAGRALGREALDTLAVPLPPAGDWSCVAVDERTREELALLELRCRHREQLRAGVETARSAGVRALLTGPSGTGKTLAARVLASALELDLYRVDLSTVVNKYIGETEKNLSRVFDRAEELDVALLLDEGDSLLTQRTDVQTAHDRYANLETNYLLQRLETFEGILLVTTNAAERIDRAFQRRMDVVIDFRAPDVAERWEIWHLHLPPGHDVDPALLEDVALRCALTGGQIRNAVVHATLLGLAAGGLGSAELEAAVRREYRKAGGVCPLRTAEVHA